MKKVVLVLFLSLVLAGCFPGLRNKSEGPSSKPGEFVKGRAVGGFPNLPLYPKARLIETYGNGTSYGANAYSRDEIAKVIKFYEDSLPKLGWESSLTQDGNGSYIFKVNDQTKKGWVIINTASDGKTVAITLAVTAR